MSEPSLWKIKKSDLESKLPLSRIKIPKELNCSDFTQSLVSSSLVNRKQKFENKGNKNCKLSSYQGKRENENIYFDKYNEEYFKQENDIELRYNYSPDLNYAKQNIRPSFEEYFKKENDIELKYNCSPDLNYSKRNIRPSFEEYFKQENNIELRYDCSPDLNYSKRNIRPNFAHIGKEQMHCTKYLYPTETCNEFELCLKDDKPNVNFHNFWNPILPAAFFTNQIGSKKLFRQTNWNSSCSQSGSSSMNSSKSNLMLDYMSKPFSDITFEPKIDFNSKSKLKIASDSPFTSSGCSIASDEFMNNDVEYDHKWKPFDFDCEIDLISETEFPKSSLVDKSSSHIHKTRNPIPSEVFSASKIICEHLEFPHSMGRGKKKDSSKQQPTVIASGSCYHNKKMSPIPGEGLVEGSWKSLINAPPAYQMEQLQFEPFYGMTSLSLSSSKSRESQSESKSINSSRSSHMKDYKPSNFSIFTLEPTIDLKCKSKFKDCSVSTFESDKINSFSSRCSIASDELMKNCVENDNKWKPIDSDCELDLVSENEFPKLSLIDRSM